MILSNKTRIFITGCGGMLGDAFYHYFNDKVTLQASDIDINEEWLTYLDVRDYDEYRKQVIAFRPDIIIHLAALTDLEYCELHPDETYMTNTTSVENSVLIANETKAILLYISTAGIFNGKKEYYDDWDSPDPINVYGRSKYMGELFVKDNIQKYFVCRAGWMMGGGPKKDKKFVKKIIDQLEDNTLELNVVDDKMGTPTYTHDFAKNVFYLLKTKFYGIYNMVCAGPTSRYEVADEILNILNKKNTILINKVSSDYFTDQYFAPRPPSEMLLNTKLKLRRLDLMTDWKSSLKEYISNFYPYLINS